MCTQGGSAGYKDVSSLPPSVRFSLQPVITVSDILPKGPHGVCFGPGESCNLQWNVSSRCSLSVWACLESDPPPPPSESVCRVESQWPSNEGRRKVLQFSNWCGGFPGMGGVTQMIPSPTSFLLTVPIYGACRNARKSSQPESYFREL